jgi:hypothetical protein
MKYVQCVDDQFGARVVRHRPAHDVPWDLVMVSVNACF